MTTETDMAATTPPVAEIPKAVQAPHSGQDPLRSYLDMANRWEAATKELDGLVSRLTRAAEQLGLRNGDGVVGARAACAAIDDRQF